MPDAPHPWPRLSADLPGPRDPRLCQCCGGSTDLSPWREHDDRDQPEPTVVVLCRACSDRLIEPHPRLYARLDQHAPHPGSMVLCLDCRHREGVRCRLAQCFGGPGVKIGGGERTTAHFLRSPRRLSGWQTWWTSPPTRCSGREVAAEPDSPGITPVAQGRLFADPESGRGPYGGGA